MLVRGEQRGFSRAKAKTEKRMCTGHATVPPDATNNVPERRAEMRAGRAVMPETQEIAAILKMCVCLWVEGGEGLDGKWIRHSLSLENPNATKRGDWTTRISNSEAASIFCFLRFFRI